MISFASGGCSEFGSVPSGDVAYGAPAGGWIPVDHARRVDVVVLVEDQDVVGRGAARRVAGLGDPRQSRHEGHQQQGAEQPQRQRRPAPGPCLQPRDHCARDGTHTLPPRGVREVACARQRLCDRRGGGAPVRADFARGSRRSARRTRASRRTGSCSCQSPSESGYVARLRIFNPDGSEAELSGNGAREAVMYLRRHHWTDADSFRIQTAAGDDLAADHLADRVHRRHGPRPAPQRRVSRRDPRTAAASSSPRDAHGAFSTCRSATRSARSASTVRRSSTRSTCRRSARRSSTTSCSRTGPTSRGSPCSAPGRIRARIFERGVGETSASGTGATGAAVAYVLDGGSSPVTVVLDGGELERRGGRRPGDQTLGLGGARVPRHARRGVRRGVTCDAVAGWI